MDGLWHSLLSKIARSAAFAAACLMPLPVAGTPRDEDLFVRAEDMHTVLFGSLDAGRSLFITTGVKRTLTGPLDRSGVVAMQSNGFGLTREHSDFAPGSTVQRITTDAAGLIGYQWALDGLYIAAYAGPELHQEQLTIAAMAGRWSKPRIGFRGQAELWMNPTRETLFTTTLVAGTTRGSLWGRMSGGVRLWGNLYAGPEVTLYLTDTYRETKFGGHLTGLDLGIFHFRVSAGIQTQDDSHRSSPYVALTSWVRL
jgi:hypothetical protein